jgi:DNA-binding MarR family transcriptional regulator
MSTKLDDAAVDDLKLALGLLVRRLRTISPSEQHELSWTQKSVIVRLEKGGPSTAADLARAESIKPQSMGTVIAQLEERGLIERKPRADDGRQMDVKLTAKAVAMRKKGNDASRTWLSQTIARLDKSEQATLFKAGEIIKRMVK